MDTLFQMNRRGRMKKILIHTGFDAFDNPSTLDILSRRVHIGGNTGNFLFANSIMRTLMVPDTELIANHYIYDFNEYQIEKINSNYSYFIMPLADAFRNGNEQLLVGLTKFVNKLKIPCIVIGVGLRSDYKQELRDYPFDSVVKDFVTAVLNTGSVIGVRGGFTGKYLNKLGFAEKKDYIVIGCPSVYTYGPLKKIQESKLSCKFQKVAFTLNVLMNNNCKRFFNKSYETSTSPYLIQQKYEEIQSLYTSNLFGIPETVLKPEIYKKSFQENQIKYFSNVVSWIAFLKDMDFSVNSRFHGSVASILAQIPTVIVPIDSRMRELVEFHQFPSVTLEDIDTCSSIWDLIDNIDFNSYAKVSNANFNNYINFLALNNLKNIFSSSDTMPCYDQMCNSIKWHTYSHSEVNNIIKCVRYIDVMYGKFSSKFLNFQRKNYICNGERKNFI